MSKRGRRQPTLEEQYKQYEKQYDKNVQHFRNKWEFDIDEKLSLEEFKTQYSIWNDEHSNILQRNKIRNFTTNSIRMGEQTRTTQLYSALSKLTGKKYGRMEKYKAMYTSKGYNALRGQISYYYEELREQYERGELDIETYRTFAKWFSHTYFGSE